MAEIEHGLIEFPQIAKIKFVPVDKKNLLLLQHFLIMVESAKSGEMVRQTIIRKSSHVKKFHTRD